MLDLDKVRQELLGAVFAWSLVAISLFLGFVEAAFDGHFLRAALWGFGAFCGVMSARDAKRVWKSV